MISPAWAYSCPSRSLISRARPARRSACLAVPQVPVGVQPVRVLMWLPLNCPVAVKWKTTAWRDAGDPAVSPVGDHSPGVMCPWSTTTTTTQTIPYVAQWTCRSSAARRDMYFLEGTVAPRRYECLEAIENQGTGKGLCPAANHPHRT